MNIARSSGILMHVTSLPGKYGIGGLGSEAHRFVDWLADAGQSFWQVLPLNPTRLSEGNSPYGSPSAFAGNTLLICPKTLYDMGLVDRKTLKSGEGLRTDRVDYVAVTAYKNRVLDTAFERFWAKRKKRKFKAVLREFESFCADNDYWLEDWAIYAVLSAHFNSPWMQWPEVLRDRRPEALAKVRVNHEILLRREKFAQYLFSRQWDGLRVYAKSRGVRLFGDLPFYVASDSADTWTHPQCFKLDADKRPTALSGVPPDSFSGQGQLWVTPVYDWEAQKSDGYAWWLARLLRNLEMYDLLRLDHFRGFSAFWEVPADRETAVDGEWVHGPGIAFFNAVRDVFPHMPFVAEDLGDIDQTVYELRDRFGLPGMNVLQYAFGSDDGNNPHLPHNHRRNSTTYVGTHDTPGVAEWWANAPKRERQNLESYVGGRVGRRKVGDVMQRMVLMSTADLAILQLQDVLGLGPEAAMNRPGTPGAHWAWRLRSARKLKPATKNLKTLTRIYGR